jgi:hypothetical protein
MKRTSSRKMAISAIFYLAVAKDISLSVAATCAEIAILTLIYLFGP